MINIIDLELFQPTKRVFLILICGFLCSCIPNSGEKDRQDIDKRVEQKEVFIDSVQCPSDTLSYSKTNDKLFERILDVYIDTENLAADNDFIVVSSNCWTDSTYIVIVDHYKWNNTVDSLVYLETPKMSSYRGFDIFFDIIQSSRFPVPNGLIIENKQVERRVEDPFSPYNEYFNDIQIVYYPKENLILSILDKLDVRKASSRYKKIFVEKRLMKYSRDEINK